MFEQYVDYFWVTLFAALVIYGLLQSVSAPFLVKSFYKKINFKDQGKSTLDEGPYQSSMLLEELNASHIYCLLYTSPSPRDRTRSRMPSSA